MDGSVCRSRYTRCSLRSSLGIVPNPFGSDTLPLTPLCLLLLSPASLSLASSFFLGTSAAHGGAPPGLRGALRVRERPARRAWNQSAFAVVAVSATKATL